MNSMTRAQPEASIVFDRAAEYYDRTRGYPEGVGERVAALICRAGGLGPHSTVLELGVGTGRIALPLAPRVGALTGVDLSRPMLTQLLAKPGAERVRAVRADVVSLPFPDRSFDAVLSFHVVHLLPAWQRALAEVKRVLRPGGLYLDASDAPLLLELWNEAYLGMQQPTIVGVRPERDTYALEEGFRRAAEPHALRYPLQLSMATFLSDLEQRVWSTTWRLSDAEHAKLCGNMRRVITTRYGSLDVVLELERDVTVRAFTPASQAIEV